MQSGRDSRPQRDLSPRRASLQRILQPRPRKFGGLSPPALFGSGAPAAQQQAEQEEEEQEEQEEQEPGPYDDSPVELDSLVDTMEEFDSLCDQLGSTLRRLEHEVSRPVGRKAWSVGSSLAESPRSPLFLSNGSSSSTTSSISPGRGRDSGDRYADWGTDWDVGLTSFQTTALRRRIANPRPRPTDDEDQFIASGGGTNGNGMRRGRLHDPAEILGTHFAEADFETSSAHVRTIPVEGAPADPAPPARVPDAEEMEAQAKLWQHGRSCIQQGAKKFLARVEAHATDAAMTVVDLYEGKPKKTVTFV